MLDDQFLLEKAVGQGGSSRVYLATHVQSEKRVAIKMLRKDKGYDLSKGARMMEKEHERMILIEGHPNILQSYTTNTAGVLDINGKHTDVMYNVLELAENGNLAYMIRATGGVHEDLAKFQFLQICHAISHIHERGIAHMDIKLENILLDDLYNIKVADLGASLDVSKSDGMTDSRRGTVCYMAPEVNDHLSGEMFDAFKADIYSLGICLYVLLFGEFPQKEEFNDSTDYDSDAIGGITGLKYSPKIKSQWNEISPECQELLSSMLSIEPDERPKIEEIITYEWFNAAYDERMPEFAFEEMEQRKQYLKTSSNRCKNGCCQVN